MKEAKFYLGWFSNERICSQIFRKIEIFVDISQKFHGHFLDIILKTITSRDSILSAICEAWFHQAKNLLNQMVFDSSKIEGMIN